MAITTTPRLGLPQYGTGGDSPSRVGFNAAFDAIDDKAAYDDGAAGGTTLPVSGVVDGRYAQTTDGAYRKLYRRAGGAWQQVGGNAWGETLHHRAATGVTQSAAARQVSHADLATPTVIEAWDGSVVRGGRFAVGDVNAAIASAIHAGDTSSAVDLTARGRIYARSTAAGHRAIVGSAGGNDHGPIFTAREVGGSEPWYVDAQGRMRAQAPTAFGAASLTTGVPLTAAPGGSDSTAAELAAGTSKLALRVLRALGDGTPIATIEQDKITLGRASWTGASVELRAPNINVIGAFDVTGASVLDALTVGGTLGVSGLSTLAGLAAGNTSITGTLGVSGATTLAGLTAGATGLGNTSITGTLGVSGTSTLAGLNAGTSALGNTTVGTLSTSGNASVTGDLSVTGRLDLPTSRPSGTSAGQIRIADDWTMEVYDGSAWRGKFGNRTGRVSSYQQTGGSISHATVTAVSGLSTFVSGSYASLSSGRYLTINRSGLWTIHARFYMDHSSNGWAATTLICSTALFAGRTTMTDTRPRGTGSGLSGGGQYQSNFTWTGYVPSGTQFQLELEQVNASSSTITNTLYMLGAEFLSD